MTITIARANGETIVTSAIIWDSMTNTAEPRVMYLSISMQRIAPTPALTEGEPVAGNLNLSIGGSRFDISLPEIPLVFTR